MIKVTRPRGDSSFISFGERLRKDKSATFSIYHLDEVTGEVQHLHTSGIPRKGRVKLRDLEMHESYLVMVGGHTAGVAATNGYNLTPPFYLTIDAAPQPQRRPVMSKLQTLMRRAMGR